MKIPEKSLWSRRGFTLIEIIIMLVVAAIVLPALILPFNVGVQDFTRPVNQGIAAFLAQEEMETKIIPSDYDDIAAWAETGITGFPDYTSSCAVTEEDGIKVITVTVSGNGEAISLTTAKADYSE